jgi:hypothetical protein
LHSEFCYKEVYYLRDEQEGSSGCLVLAFAVSIAAWGRQRIRRGESAGDGAAARPLRAAGALSIAGDLLASATGLFTGSLRRKESGPQKIVRGAAPGA